MKFPDPFALFLRELCSTDSLTESSRKTATFIRTNEERCEAPLLFKSMLRAAQHPRQRERLIFSLLDISRADFEIVTRALRMRQLRRLFNKAACFPQAVTSEETMLLTELGRYGITVMNRCISAGRMASTWMRRMAEGEPVGPKERTLFARLLTAEVQLLKQRTIWLSENVDAYDMRAIARLMPLLSVCDEQGSVLEEIASRLENGGSLGRTVLTLEYAMKSDYFEKWLRKTGAEPSLHPWLRLISEQRAKLIPTVQLVAVATLSRLLHRTDTPELTWIAHALSSCTTEGFRMDTGQAINRIQPLLAQTTVTITGTVLSGTFSETALTALIATDMLPRHLEEDADEPSPRELVMRCISNDALLLRLLDNPKIAGTPGLVAKVAATTRSLAVLQKIATKRELYTGQPNREVPLALLRNPAHIPLLHLRPFMNVKYITLMDMKDILHNPYGVRKEVFEEIRQIVEQRYR